MKTVFMYLLFFDRFFVTYDFNSFFPKKTGTCGTTAKFTTSGMVSIFCFFAYVSICYDPPTHLVSKSKQLAQPTHPICLRNIWMVPKYNRNVPENGTQRNVVGITTKTFAL